MPDTVVIGRGVLRLLAESAGLRGEVTRAAKAAGAGQDVEVKVRADGSGLWRDVNGYLRDNRGRFAKSGETTGTSISQGMRKAFRRSSKEMFSGFDFMPFSAKMLGLAAAAIPAAAAISGLAASLGMASTALAAAGPLLLGVAGVVGSVMLAFKSLDAVQTTAGKNLRAELTRWKEGIKSLQATAQKNVLPGVTAFLQLARGLLPTVNRHIGQMGTLAGRTASEVGVLTASPLFRSQLAAILGNNELAFNSFASSVVPAVRFLTALGAATSELGVRFGQVWLRGTQVLANWIELKAQSGELSAYFNRAGDALGTWWRIARDLLAGLVNVMRAALPSGEKMASGLERSAAAFRSWTGSLQGQTQMRQFFDYMASIDYQRIFQVAAAVAAVGLAMKGITLTQGVISLFATLAGLGPVGLAIAAVVIVVGALAAAFGYLYAASSTFRGEIAGVIAAVRDNLGPGFSRFADLLTTRVGPAIMDVLLPKMREFGSFIKGTLLPVLGEMLNNHVPKLERAWTTISNAFRDNKKELSALWEAFKTVVVWLTENVLPVLGKVAGFLTGVVAGAISFVIKYISSWVSMWQWLSDTASNIREKVGSVIDSVVGFFQALPGKVLAAIVAFPGMLLGFITGALNAVLFFIGFWIGSVVGFWIALPGRVVSAIAALPGLISGIWDSAAAWTVSIVSGLVDRVGSFFGSIPGRVSAGLSALGGAVMGAFNTAVSAAGSGVDKVSGVISSIPGKALNALGNLGGILWDAGASLIRGLISGVESQIGNLRSKLGEITSMIPKVKGPEDKDRMLLYPAGRAIIDGLVGGIDHEVKGLHDRLGQITAEIGATTPKTPRQLPVPAATQPNVTYLLHPGAVTLDLSKIEDIRQLLQLLSRLETTARQHSVTTRS